MKGITPARSIGKTPYGSIGKTPGSLSNIREEPSTDYYKKRSVGNVAEIIGIVNSC